LAVGKLLECSSLSACGMGLSTTPVDRLMARCELASAVTVRRMQDWLALPFRAAVPAALRRWREDQETWDALRLLDDRQLKDFGIHRRPPELVEQKLRPD
jgi:uncharacterized protein YjiS (DUF1127 family)